MHRRRWNVRLGIVIPVFNRWSQTERCLRSLSASHFREFVVYVVDHGSTDGTALRLLQEFPECICIEGDASWWWSAASNAGIERALRDGLTYIMLLNSDCVVRPDTMERVLKGVMREARTIVAPVQVSLGTGNPLAYRVRTALTLGFPTIRDYFPLPASRRGLHPVRLIMGGRGVVIPAAAFAEIGLFDQQRLPHYAADHDFYLRARKAGWVLAIVPDAHVEVDDSTTTLADRPWTLSLGPFFKTLRERRSHRNLHDLRAFFKKHHPVPGLAPVGVALNVARYLAIYALRRPWTLVCDKIHAIGRATSGGGR